jgi:hypothetical protein
LEVFGDFNALTTCFCPQQINNFVKIMYAIGCSMAVMQALFYPMVLKLAMHLCIHNSVVWRTNTEDFGDIMQLDIVASISRMSRGDIG